MQRHLFPCTSILYWHSPTRSQVCTKRKETALCESFRRLGTFLSTRFPTWHAHGPLDNPRHTDCSEYLTLSKICPNFHLTTSLQSTGKLFFLMAVLFQPVLVSRVRDENLGSVFQIVKVRHWQKVVDGKDCYSLRRWISWLTGRCAILRTRVQIFSTRMMSQA